MGALKGLVIGLGLTIVLVMGVLVWGLYKKSENPDFKMFTFSGQTSVPTTAESPVGAPAPSGVVPSWGTVSLNLPQGCAVTGVSAVHGHVAVLSGPVAAPMAGCARVTIVETRTGRILGTVTGGP